MVIVVVVILLCFIFDSKRRKSYVISFLKIGFFGLVGCIVSVSLGSLVVPGHYALTRTNVLETAVIDGKEKFILKRRNNWGATTYTYFIRTNQGNVVGMGIAEEKIRYKQGVRMVRKFKKEFNNEKLSWIFFCAREYNEVVISGKDDVFDDSRILLIDL